MIRMAPLGLLAVAAPALMAPALAAAPAGKAVATRAGLCRAGEVPIFSCRLGRKSVAVCGSTAPSGVKSAQYRFGVPGQIEMTYPGQQGGPLGLATVPYSGGGEAQVSFARGGYRYVVYSNVIRTSFGADGLHNPAFTSGLIVLKDGKVVTNSKCTSPPDAPVSTADARRFGIGEGEFVEHP